MENLGIPEEELLRQQQELFAKVSEETIYAVLIFPHLIVERYTICEDESAKHPRLGYCIQI